MKKNRTSESGLFRPRIFLAFGLCLTGVLLAMLSFAAPTSSGGTAAQSPSELKPVVSKSVANGVSRAVRDLPIATSTGQGIADELLPVLPNHPVPAGFVDAALQTAPAAVAAPTPIANFEGQSSVDSAGGSAVGCLCVPPDTNGAVGPTQYVQMVNSVFSVYDKAGTRLSGPTQINALWSDLPGQCQANNNGDPVVLYDQLADRWLVSQFAVPTGDYHECIAISQTSDATGAYYVYDFPLSTTKFEDYPHFGLWPDAYYMSAHQFNTAGTAYLGQAAFAFERDKMLKGQPAQLLYFDFNLGAFQGQLPANLDGFTLPPPGAPNYFVEVNTSADAVGNGLRIWKFHVDWTTPANSTFGVNGQPNSRTTVTNFARPNCVGDVTGCVPQLGDSYQVEPIGDRLMYRLAYRNFGDHEALVLNHTVVADGTTGQMGIRWYEVRDPGGTPTIFQQSTWGPTSQTDLLYRWMGSIAMDRGGNMAIGYSTSNQISFPSIAYAGRLAGDTLNTLGQGETQLFAGTGPQHDEVFIPLAPTRIGRWGDYTDLTVDPLDDCTFWYTNEYYASPDDAALIWHTRIGSFKFPTCVPPALQLVSVVSRMTHGSITPPFDINLPLTPPRGVECRRSTSLGAGNYTLVFTFSNYLQSVGSAQVTAHDPATGTGTVITSVMGPGLKQYTVNLTNVSSGQYITVTLNSVLDSLGNSANIVSPQMGVLVGDVNADGGASNLDVSLVKAKVAAGASVDSSNFRDDVNADGGFSNLDVSITKAQVAAGQTLPSTP